MWGLLILWLALQLPLGCFIGACIRTGQEG